MADVPPAPTLEAQTRNWHAGWKALASALVLFHLVSMVVASYCAGQASPLVYDAYEVCGRYAQVMYVNHGYRFFSPEPGAATLIEFDAVLQDGSRTSETIPNRGEGGQWPRVFYHRHFMLTEFLGVVSDRPVLAEQVVNTYASHYLRIHPEVAEVTLVRVIHTLPTPEFIRAGGDLLHQSTYIRDPLGTFRWDSGERSAVRIDDDPGYTAPAPAPRADAADASPQLVPSRLASARPE